ncbi:hypothetical protein TKK_0011093 [Trichogramma kaykai]
MDLDMSYADNFTLQDEIETFSVTSVPSLDMLSDKNKKAIKKLHKKGYLKINPLQSHGKIETDHNDSMTFQVKNSVITPECLSEVKGDQCHASATSTQKSRKRKIRNIHVSFLRTVPPYSHQADVWVELLKYFNYMKIIFIHTSDAEGRSLLGRFQSTSQIIENEMDIKIQVEYIIELNPGMSSYKYSLQELNKAQSRVYLLHASEQDADVIFKNAAEMNMTGTGAVWIVTEQALNSKNIPTGALGLRLINATDEKSHIKDSLYVFMIFLQYFVMFKI